MLAITERGYAAMAFIKAGGTAFKPRRQGQDADRAVSEAGLAAIAEYERAHRLQPAIGG